MGQPSAQTVRQIYAYDGNGQKTRSVDALGVVTASLYDGNGYLTKQVGDEGGLDLTTESRYDTFANVTERINPEGGKTWYYYDNGELLTKEVRVLDNGDPSKQYAVTYWYDASERVVSKKVENKDQDGASLTPAEFVSTYLHDLEGRVTRETFQVDATSSVTKAYLVDGNGAITRIIQPNGTEEGYVIDERGEVYQKQNCAGCGSTAITLYTSETGQLTKRVDSLGNSVQMFFDGFDRMTRKAWFDNAGTPALLVYEEQEYDAKNNVTRRTVRDAADTVVARSTYYYDELNRLYDTRQWAEPTDAEGDDDARTVYLYDAASRMSKVKTYLSGTDASPVLAETSTYSDNAGRTTRRVDAEGAAVSYYYDQAGGVTRQTDPEGYSTTYVYDALGRTTRITNAGSHYSVTYYDSDGRALTSISYASGGTALAKAAYTYDGLARQITARRFADPTGAANDSTDEKIVAYFDANGLVTKSEDPNGNASTAYYDTYNRLQWRRDPLGNKAEYVYDSNNNVLTTIRYEIDQLDSSTKTTRAASLYDGLGRATKSIDQGPDGDISATSDNAETIAFYDAQGRVTKATDALSVSVVRLYDGLGRITRQTADPGGVGANVDAMYDRAGRKTISIDPKNHATEYVYSSRGNATRVVDPIGNYVARAYDGRGMVTRTTSYEVDQAGGGNKTFVADALYDALGRATKGTDQGKDGDIAQTADNGVTTYYYDGIGRVTGVVDAEGVATASLYDGLGRLTRKTEDAGGLDRDVDFVYEKAGRMTRITDDLGQDTDYVLDAIGRVTRTVYEDHDASADTVDIWYCGGRPTKRKDQRAIETVYLYDGLGRLTKKQDDPTNPGIVETTEHDKFGRMTSAILTNGGTEQADVRQYYDALGRLTRESQQIKGGDVRNVNYAYDQVSRTMLAYPGASRVVNFNYDAANRISLIKNGSNAVAQYLYVGGGRVSERKYLKASDGSTEVTTLHALYDGVGRITRWYHDRSDDSVVVGFQYDRDKVGNPKYKLREHESNKGDEYTYDALYRLTRAIYDDPTPTSPTASPAAATTDDFGYDNLGNRTRCHLESANATEYLHNPVNEYTKETTNGVDKVYGHDAAGNLTRAAAAEGSDTNGDWRYYFDYENFMTKAEQREDGAWVTKAECARDALGRRIENVADGTTIRYYHDRWRVIEETEGTVSPTVERQYVFGNGIDEVLVMFRKEDQTYAPYYYLADPMWTVEALLNDDAAIVEAYGYRAYGEPTVETGAGNDGVWFTADDATSTTTALGNTMLFTGRNWDHDTELYYNRARMYDPREGRFGSRDAAPYADGSNLHTYANNNPGSLQDPFGYESYEEAKDAAKKTCEKLYEGWKRQIEADPGKYIPLIVEEFTQRYGGEDDTQILDVTDPASSEMIFEPEGDLEYLSSRFLGSYYNRQCKYCEVNEVTYREIATFMCGMDITSEVDFLVNSGTDDDPEWQGPGLVDITIGVRVPLLKWKGPVKTTIETRCEPFYA